MVILNDFQTTVRKALKEIDPNWESYNGLIICGTHDPKNTEELIELIHQARINKIPFLGICFGHQLAAIEYARNVKGIVDATSEEFGIGTYVVKKRKDLNVGWKGEETYWNNYEVDIPFENPDWFVTCQFHPEYQSSKLRPHPLLVKFINICRNVAGLSPLGN